MDNFDKAKFARKTGNQVSLDISPGELMIKDSPVIRNYNIIKTAERKENTAVFIVEEVESKEKFILKKLLKDTINSIYEKSVKRHKETVRKYLSMKERMTTPAVRDFFTDDEYFYAVINYKNSEDINTVISYTSIGKVLNNRYLVLNGLSFSPASAVYLVLDLDYPDKYMALKEMDYKENFTYYGESLIELSHPGIVQISDFFIEEKKSYIVMEYLSGETLKEKICNLKKEESFFEEEIIFLALSICEVLEYMNEEFFIYENLRADNIIIDEKGDIKLTGFNVRKGDSADHIYSFGVILYNLITGINPEKDLLPPEHYNKSISTELGKITLNILSPETELKNIKEIGEELSRLDILQKKEHHLDKASSYELEGNFLKANYEYIKVVEMEGENYETLLSIARCYEKMGLGETSLEYYNKVLKFRIPDNLRKKILARLHIVSKKLEEQGFLEKRDYKRNKRRDTFAIDVIPGEFMGDNIDEVKGSLTYYKPGKGKVSVPLYKEVTEIGRAGSNDLILDFDREVSGRHAKIVFKENSFFIEDLGSTNNTYVNGVPVKSGRELRNDDKIQVGSVKFHFNGAVEKKKETPPVPLSTSGSAFGPAKLVYYKYGRRKISFPLNKACITIGRRKNNDIVLEYDLEVSGQHARIVKEENAYFLEDLGSTNHTFLNDIKINSRTRLNHKDKIRTGYVSFTFVKPGGTYTEPLSKFLF